MGVYLYTLRKPLMHAKCNGRLFTIAKLAFYRKPYWNEGTGYGVGMDKYSKMGVSKARSNWATEPLPYFVVIGDKIENGLSVRRWNVNATHSMDEPDFHGFHVGKLVVHPKNILEVEPEEKASTHFDRLPIGTRFSFSEYTLGHFNPATFKNLWKDELNKTEVTGYTPDDVFVKETNSGNFVDLQHGKRYDMGDTPSPVRHGYVRARIKESLDVILGDTTEHRVGAE